MQKKIIALAVAGLSTAAFAQTNVTIYGVADVSAQGTNMSSSKALAYTPASPATNVAGKVASGGAFNMVNNSSLIGFKGTEDLGNGLKALFQIETNVNLTGGSTVAVGSGGTTFTSARDSYVGLNSKYGTVLGGFLSTPYRSALTSFDVMPGATGSGRNENLIGKIRLNNAALNAPGGVANTSTNGVQADSSVRATALAYALPTLYGFNGSIAYTGSANNGAANNTTTTAGAPATLAPQSAMSFNLGWDGYGVGIKGAFQQAKVNNTLVPIGQSYTSYLIGAQYTGVPGLKVAALYNRNTLATNTSSANSQIGPMKGSNNQFWAGVSYRFGNNEPRLSYATTSDTSGLTNVTQGVNMGQDGGNQWTANWGYYLSKRTQVYGLVSSVKNNANGIWAPMSTTGLTPTGGQNFITYGAGMRTNF